MNTKTIVSISVGVILVIAIAGGAYAMMGRSGNDDAMMKTDHSMMEGAESMKKDEAMEKDAMEKTEVMDKGDVDTAMKDDEQMEDKEVMEKEDVKNDEVMMEKAGSYVAYDASKIAEAATTGDAILFFHASWCPTCSALNKDIEANLADIPKGMTIFKTDYDSQTELKKKYGVTYQHTLVQVDKDGNVIKKWSGGNTLESIVSKVQ
jgi:hypothetical protein